MLPLASNRSYALEGKEAAIKFAAFFLWTRNTHLPKLQPPRLSGMGADLVQTETYSKWTLTCGAAILGKIGGSSGCRKRLQYCGSQFVRVETKRSGPTLVGYPPARVNQVKSIRPAGVGRFGRVSKFVQHRRNLDAQLAHASTSDKSAFVFAARAGEYNFFLYVALHLPDVAGVRFGDVDDQKCDPVSELLVELVEGRNLPPEGRSGTASKHQHHRSILRSQR